MGKERERRRERQSGRGERRRRVGGRREGGRREAGGEGERGTRKVTADLACLMNLGHTPSLFVSYADLERDTVSDNELRR